MSIVLSTTIMGTHFYVKSTSVRTWDNKKLLNLTKKIEDAKTFTSNTEAFDFLSMCITNNRKYITEPYQTKKS